MQDSKAGWEGEREVPKSFWIFRETYLLVTCTCMYLWYEEYCKNGSYEYINQATKNSSVSIQEVAQQHGTDNHDNNHERGEIDDRHDILSIVQDLNLYVPCLDCQNERNELSQEDVEKNDYDPDEITWTLADQVLLVKENIVFLRLQKCM